MAHSFRLPLCLWVFAFFGLGTGRLFTQTPTVGLTANEAGAFTGYTLIAPQRSDSTYLIDQCGRLVHTWGDEYEPGNSAYLLPDGRLLRTASEGQTANVNFVAGGASDRIRLRDWEGALLWDWKLSNAQFRLHHDVAWMPNGHVLAIAWEAIGFDAGRAAGRSPANLGASVVWSEIILEVEPIFPDSGRIVWQWRAWDHLIQDFDSTRANFGTVAEHPERIDVNYLGLQSPNDPDWLHFNSIAYHPLRDEIMLSSREFCEFWIIDHSTNTLEAAGTTGGSAGRGGDLLYRWGNPEAYRAGSATDKQLFAQHDAHWIADSLADGGRVMVFNNGTDRPGGNASSVDILELPQDRTGAYIVPNTGAAFGPLVPVWRYFAPVPTDFYAIFVSNAQRLPNGNTFINEGVFGHLFEINPQGEVVWDYISPVDDMGRIAQGDVPSAGPSGTLNNRTFRVYRYDPDYTGLAGRDLTPGAVLELNPLPDPCNPPIGVADGMVAPHFSFYPNPATTYLQVQLPGKASAWIELRDVYGRAVWQGKIAPGSHRIPVAELPAGTYLVLGDHRPQGRFVRTN
ncbi:MAG: aryl-sulfate sulfotransferase [Bacteroidota bacterium]